MSSATRAVARPRELHRFVLRRTPGQEESLPLPMVHLGVREPLVESLEPRLLLSRASTFVVQNLPVVAKPYGILATDFNGDGRLDLVVVGYQSECVEVLYGQGNGTFGGQQDYAMPTGSGPYQIASGDFNGDTRLDLAIVGA
jgi:hypothetical protein